jgi:uncharacterized protein with HEPN domain
MPAFRPRSTGIAFVSTDREAQRLQDIIDNVTRIESHVAGMEFDAFAADTKTVDAVERCLQRITEAVIKIGPERMAAISPRTPVEAVRGLGNLLRHDYDGVDLDTIWRTVRESLPELRVDCARALV